MTGSGTTIICGANWLGDSVMSMPALQGFARRRPDVRLVMVCRPGLRDLWAMHPDVDAVETYAPTVGGTWRAARVVAGAGASEAYVFPNSFRSALVPFLARVPRRVGAAGHWRRFLLTAVVDTRATGEGHQALEYIRLVGGSAPGGAVEAPSLKVPGASLEIWRKALGGGERREWVALVPGAARGPSKRWPADRFIEVGRGVVGRDGFSVVVAGTDAESAVCAQVADGIGPGAVNVAGKTTLTDLAAVLNLCRTAVVNDSGAMHLAAAVGTPVVAVYGLTDPVKTGPLGAGHRVIRRPGVQGAREIARDSAEARACLESIGADEVMAAVEAVLSGGAGHAV